MKAASTIPGTRKKNRVRVADARNYARWLAAPKHQLKDDKFVIYQLIKLYVLKKRFHGSNDNLLICTIKLLVITCFNFMECRNMPDKQSKT
jgi:hypothetical protein